MVLVPWKGCQTLHNRLSRMQRDFNLSITLTPFTGDHLANITFGVCHMHIDRATVVHGSMQVITGASLTTLLFDGALIVFWVSLKGLPACLHEGR